MIRIVQVPDYLRSGRTKYVVQRKYRYWPWWDEFGKYDTFVEAKDVCDALLNPVLWSATP